MNPVRKRPAYLFAKDFQIENVLGNLQGYKIASGQLEKSDLDNVKQRFGSDEGIVFGSLITKAGEIKGKEHVDSKQREIPSGKRKRRRRKRRKTNSDNKPSSSIGVCSVTEPLSIPSSILEYGSSSDESNTKGHHSNEDDRESEDSTSDEDESTDFFGLLPDKVEPETSVETHAEITLNESTCTFKENDTISYFESCSHPYPEVRIDMDEWDVDKQRYKQNTSTLSTYKCWKCKRIGHLAEDCTVQGTSVSRAQREEQVTPSILRDYFKRCQVFRTTKDAKCSECIARSNLVSCLDCGVIFCDGRGHLTDHLMCYPSHNKLYSFKLRRLIKCCKPTCQVVDATKLLMCSTCLSKQFNSHYNMINATWSKSGLKGIPNTLACEQHFQWHRINCTNTMEEPLLCQEKLENAKQRNDGLLSEFYF